MRHFDFNSSGNLHGAIHAYSDPRVKRLLSFDGQVYFECTPCNRHFWCNPLYLSELAGPILAEAKCDRCGNTSLKPRKFCHFMTVLCGGCGNLSEFEVQEAYPCPKCEGTRFQILTLSEVPSFPRTFGTLIEPKAKDWGVSVTDDLEFLSSTVRSFRSGAGFHATCVHLIAFLRNLSVQGEYAGEVLGSEILNWGAQLLKQVYRETGDLNVALEGVALAETVLEKVDDPTSKALYGHNVAANIYSFLARGQEMVANAMKQRDYRAEALRHAKAAYQIYPTAPELDAETREIKQGEIEWLIGDILGADDPPEKSLRESLEWFDKALARTNLPDRIRGFVEESKNSKVQKLQRFVKESNQIASPARPTIADERYDDAPQEIQRLHSLAKAKLRDGDSEAALKFLVEAYALIRSELSSSSRDAILRHHGTQLMAPVVLLAKILAMGIGELQAMAVLEEFRMFAIWQKDSGDQIARKSAMIGLTHSLAGLLSFGRTKVIPFNQNDLNQAVKETEAAFKDLASHCRESVLVVMLELSGGEVVAFVTRLADGAITFKYYRSDLCGSDALVDRMLTVASANEPSPLRQKRVHNLIVAAKGSFGGIWQELSKEEVENIILITSGGVIPFEAFSVIDSSKQNPTRLSYAPSLAIASSMAKAWSARSSMRVLAVGYQGDDLPAVGKEIELIRKLFGDQAEVMSGSSLQKKTILERLQKAEFDILHFACHGSYDPTAPMKSHLRLAGSGKPSDSEITAQELVALGSFKSPPLIVLSACSTAVISMNGSNNFLGLSGAFLRLGISGMVASRWPVVDEVALEFVNAFYSALRDGKSPAAAVRHAQIQLKASRPIDDWAAFMFIGS